MLTKLIALFCFLPLICFSQDKASNIYHFKLSKVGNELRLKSPQFLTAFNKAGYNNQPSFVGDDEIYFTTDYYDSEQTEIAKFDMFDKTLTRITYTPEKEYSPLLVPGKEDFSVVRVEEDGKTQTLSIYPINGIGYAKRFMNNTSNIGYHTWIDEETIGMFLVEPPHHNLAIAHVQSERRKIVLDNIGRCLKVDKSGKLVFVHKESDEVWLLKAYNNSTNKSVLIAETLSGSEDFEILKDGSILMGNGSKLYILNPKVPNRKWKEVADFTPQGIKNIERLAVRKNRLVIVDNS